MITGSWATDNTAELFVNGDYSSPVAEKTGYFDGDGYSDFGSLDDFIITDGFKNGDNSLEFVVYNEGGPSGLLVSELTATVPAPGAFLLGGIGLSIVGYIKKRRMLN